MDSIIKVNNISKQYRLGQVGTGTISHDLNRWWHRVRGREDPYLKIGEVNDRTKKGESEYAWALQNINFEVEKGEVVGIIGRNGAGKSTLLKILSRTTAPTTGNIKIKGRVASLLEVGTGFHPELTGAENIFLNGAILGMTKQEIKAKFDEIVEFAGVERYIDTPVKRYSSGMYVRLAFAVAAHLSSEILIVDEVLAVGDAEFQKKCLNKMSEVSRGEGKTILFVSHTMPSVKQLCRKAILLRQGTVEMEGLTSDVINTYLADKSVAPEWKVALPEHPGSDLYFTGVSIVNKNNEDLSVITNEDSFFVKLSFKAIKDIDNIEISICFKNSNGVNIFFTSLSDSFSGKIFDFKKGQYQTTTRIRANFLLPDTYTIDIYGHHRNHDNLNWHQSVIKFSIVDIGSYMSPYGKAAADFTAVLETCQWQLTSD